MNESVIIQKLIQVGQMLERGELEYSGAEIDTKYYLEQYVALRQPPVSGSVCDCQIPKPIDAYHPIDKHICRDCNRKIAI